LVIFGAENLVDIFQVFWVRFGFLIGVFCDPTLEAPEKAFQTATAYWKKSPLCLSLLEGHWESILTGHLRQEEDFLLPPFKRNQSCSNGAPLEDDSTSLPSSIRSTLDNQAAGDSP
jgi:hypothetical protein